MVELSPSDDRCASASVLRRAEGNRLLFFCPGCQCYHGPTLDRWTWNGSMDRPTFSPSILVTGTQPITDEERDRIMAGETVEPRPLRCHSFVRDGQVEFLSDCTHELAGKTVALEPDE